jgi:hypothetical protein
VSDIADADLEHLLLQRPLCRACGVLNCTEDEGCELFFLGTHEMDLLEILLYAVAIVLIMVIMAVLGM